MQAFEDLRGATDRLFQGDPQGLSGIQGILSSITGVYPDSDRVILAKGTSTLGGAALSPDQAAQCFIDWERTRRFLLGTENAISEAQKRFPSQKIRVLYAGCGPFASLCVPLTTRLKADEVEFTLLDIHEESIALVRKIIEAIRQYDFFKEIIAIDAFQFQQKEKYHVILLETLSYGLSREPQLGLTYHLSQYLEEDGLFIPEEVRISPYLADISDRPCREPPFNQYWGDPLLRLRHGIREQFPQWDFAQEIPLGERIIPEIVRGQSLYLETEVVVFGGQTIAPNNAVVTAPYFMGKTFGQESTGRLLQFSYNGGRDPHFHVQQLDA